jgi:hypothetical protein
MEHHEIRAFRQRLEKTQKELSELLGTSIKAIQSFEQGWRKVPVHIERQMLFLLTMKGTGEKGIRPCWEIRSCPPQTREACPAWEFKAGHLCWFINGTICRGKPQNSWGHKMRVCRKCEVLSAHMNTEGVII